MKMSVEGKAALAHDPVCSAVTWLCAAVRLQKDTAHRGTTVHGPWKATWPGELNYLWTLTFSQMSQEEAVLYKSLLQLPINLFIYLSYGPCTFGVSEDEVSQYLYRFLVFSYLICSC